MNVTIHKRMIAAYLGMCMSVTNVLRSDFPSVFADSLPYENTSKKYKKSKPAHFFFMKKKHTVVRFWSKTAVWRNYNLLKKTKNNAETQTAASLIS